jgi:hypothetical protein
MSPREEASGVPLTDAQRASIVLGGTREFGGLLEVLDRDHALQVEVGIHDQHLLDAMLVEQIQGSVRVFEGDWTNIKITTTEDLVLAEALLAAGRAT